MSQLVFSVSSTSNEPGKASKATGELSLNGEPYAAVSGGYGKGALSFGTYTVKVRHVVDSNLRDAFKIGTTQFFIPIESSADSTRSGLGIHPDGNVPGTEGCIGLQDDDARKFWKNWMSIPLGSRPTTLIVKVA